MAVKAWAARCAARLSLHEMYLSFGLAGSMSGKMVYLLFLCMRKATARYCTGQGFWDGAARPNFFPQRGARAHAAPHTHQARLFLDNHVPRCPGLGCTGAGKHGPPKGAGISLRP